MAKLVIVVDKLQDWAPFYQYDGVMSLPDYLKWQPKQKQRVRVINLCRQSHYLGTGYYCSLLAEARGHNVMPSLRAFNKFNRHEISELIDELPGTLQNLLDKALADANDQQLIFNIYFGETSDKTLRKFASYLFDALPVPILRVELTRKKNWQIRSIRIGAVHKLTDIEQGHFAEVLERYSHKIWRLEPKSARFKYDLAILTNPKEAFPPCTPKSIDLFRKAAKRAAMDTELISARDIQRLAEFDGLFIRETTGVNHHTFHLAVKAEREGLAVIDDPNSILRCGNKVYLQTLFQQHKVPVPDGLMLFKQDEDNLERAADTLGLPLVLKIPDGSFFFAVSLRSVP